MPRPRRSPSPNLGVIFGGLGFVALLVIGCVVAFAMQSGVLGEPRLDGSSDKAYEASMGRVRSKLNEREIQQCEVATVLLDKPEISLARLTKPAAIDAEFRRKVDGLTATELIAKGRAIANQRLDDAQEKLTAERKEYLVLEAKVRAGKVSPVESAGVPAVRLKIGMLEDRVADAEKDVALFK